MGETIKEATKKYKNYYEVNAFSDGVKWQAERSYSEEDIILYSDYVADCRLLETYPIFTPKEWFEQFKNK